MSGQGEPPPVALTKLLQQAKSQPKQFPQHNIHHHNRAQSSQGSNQYRHQNHQANQYPNQRFQPQNQAVPLTAFVRGSQNHPPANQYSQQAHQNYAHSNQHYYANHNPQRSRGQPNYAKAIAAQDAYLTSLLQEELPKVIATHEEIAEKYEFLGTLEKCARKNFAMNFASESIFFLVPYGSIESGFASKGSDVDCVVVWDHSRPPPSQEERDALPRLLEATTLEHSWGARLLANTRVPILKVCGSPSPELLEALRKERQKWEDEIANPPEPEPVLDKEHNTLKDDPVDELSKGLGNVVIRAATETPSQQKGIEPLDSQDTVHSEVVDENSTAQRRPRGPGPLDFPPSAAPLVDINFTMELGILNTKLLRCYSACDPRVLEMVHFVKSWSKNNKLASSYNGTLCSYGWVLMILHYLMNIARPPVIPNLQLNFPHMPLNINGTEVGFFDNPAELASMAQRGQLFQGGASNPQSTATLLRGFFHYYAHQGGRVPGGGFRWRDDVISLRVRGGLVAKISKGWTASSSSNINGVEVKQRYLLALECPIEVDHNVARTVVHKGIVEIRDTLRRAWSVLEGVANDYYPQPGEGIMDYRPTEVQNDTRPASKGNNQSTPKQDQHIEASPSTTGV
jgi:terminal uridylyltransferase